MKIGIDYFPATTHWPGVGRYAREFVRALVHLDDAPQVLLFDIGGEPRTIGEPDLGLKGAPRGRVRRIRLRAPRRAFQAIHSTTGMGVDRVLGRVDLFHRIHADWPPVSRAIQVQPFGELPPPDSREEEQVGRQLERADHVLAMSRHGASEVLRRFGLDPDRVHAVPIGSDQWVRQVSELCVRDEPPRILVLGAVRAVRYHAAILAAFELLHARGLAGELHCIGADGDASADFEALVAHSSAGTAVRWDKADREEKTPEAVARAAVLVHLSEGEESAVTPLEAFSLGTPVVASNLGAFAEVLDGQAELLDNARAVEDPEYLSNRIAGAIASAWDAEAEERRRAIARRYTWRENAAATIEVWRRILR